MTCSFSTATLSQRQVLTCLRNYRAAVHDGIWFVDVRRRVSRTLTKGWEAGMTLRPVHYDFKGERANWE